MTKAIPLTQGQYAIVDDCDYDYLLAIGSWCYSNASYAVHYGRHDDGHRTTISMHRVIMARVLGRPVPPDLVVDHIDRNRLRNTRDNLRIATRSQNQANKGTQINTPVGFKGVTVDGDKFRSRIKFDRGKRLHLGQYADAETAARVYDAASRLLNREFAGCNFPDETTTQEILDILRRYVSACPAALAYLARVGRLEELGIYA